MRTVLDVKGWFDGTCSIVLPFLCHWKIVLVQKNKTWEEALQYCRENYRGLACLTSELKILLAETEAAQSETVSVWSGLRFMNGRWFWLSWEWLELPWFHCTHVQ